jgi:hypothetical protein
LCSFDLMPSWWFSFAATTREIGIEDGERFSHTRTAQTVG